MSIVVAKSMRSTPIMTCPCVSLKKISTRVILILIKGHFKMPIQAINFSYSSSYLTEHDPVNPE